MPSKHSINKKTKRVVESIDQLNVSVEVKQVLFQIWDEVDSAYYEQNRLLRRDGVRLLNLSAELVMALRANGEHRKVPKKLEQQILKMRRTWQGKKR